jgi:3-oxoadipate enol-lactonase
MSFANLKDVRLRYDSAGAEDAPVIVLSNSLGTALEMWDPQIDAFSKQFRVLRYDPRGHGQSSVEPGPYSLKQLAADVIHLLDSLNIGKAHFCGISMGGAVGFWLAIHHPDRFAKFALCNTAAKFGTAETWNARLRSVEENGMPSIAEQTMERWFTQNFRNRHPEVVARLRSMVAACPHDGYKACCIALREVDLRAEVSKISSPTLLVAGTYDPTTPPSALQELQQQIRDSRLVELNAAHLSNVEQSAMFNSAVLQFFTAEN